MERIDTKAEMYWCSGTGIRTGIRSAASIPSLMNWCIMKG